MYDNELMNSADNHVISVEWNTFGITVSMVDIKNVCVQDTDKFVVFDKDIL